MSARNWSELDEFNRCHGNYQLSNGWTEELNRLRRENADLIERLQNLRYSLEGDEWEHPITAQEDIDRAIVKIQYGDRLLEQNHAAANGSLDRLITKAVENQALELKRLKTLAGELANSLQLVASVNLKMGKRYDSAWEIANQMIKVARQEGVIE